MAEGDGGHFCERRGRDGPNPSAQGNLFIKSLRRTKPGTQNWDRLQKLSGRDRLPQRHESLNQQGGESWRCHLWGVAIEGGI